MTLRIFRYEVPVDDQVHEIDLWGDPLTVACNWRDDVVEFWAYAVDGALSFPLPAAARRGDLGDTSDDWTEFVCYPFARRAVALPPDGPPASLPSPSG